MKTSVSLSLFQAHKNAPVLFSGDIEKNIPKIKDMGFDGVDLFVLHPNEDISIKAIKLLKKYGLGVGAVMPAALAEEGLFLSHKDKNIRQKIAGRMKEIIYYASQLGGMVSLGLVRGNAQEDEAASEVLDRFTDSIEKLIPSSEEYGVDLIVEPINRYEINTLNSSIETYDYIKKTGLPLYLMLDTFHMNIEDADIEESLLYCKDLIRHVHFLDSNRLAPGMGHTDMEIIYNVLKQIGYEGFLCLEALARPDAITCAEKGMEFFKKTGAAAP